MCEAVTTPSRIEATRRRISSQFAMISAALIRRGISGASAG
jgi:hypothetical protein